GEPVLRALGACETEKEREPAPEAEASFPRRAPAERKQRALALVIRALALRNSVHEDLDRSRDMRRQHDPPALRARRDLRHGHLLVGTGMPSRHLHRMPSAVRRHPFAATLALVAVAALTVASTALA